MDRIDALKTLKGWTSTSVVHFRDLAVYGEQILLSVRWGADEFLIVLSDVPLVGAALFAERVRAAVEDLSEGSPERLTCSGAVVELGRHESPAAAIRRAELHLRAARAAGGNRIHGALLDDDTGHDGPRNRREPTPKRLAVRD